MNFEELEKTVRTFIAQNKLEESINLLNDFFKDDPELDSITIQSANYYSILDKKIKGTVGDLEVDLALNKLRSNILNLLRAKNEYLKYKNKTFGEDTRSEDTGLGVVEVFFSVGSPHNDRQQAYIDNLVNYFRKNGIILDTLKEWDDSDPLVPIIKKLKNSCGCIVLALERLYVNEGFEKRGSGQQSTIANKAFTSTWLHIEASIARSLDLPLIIFKDKTLKNDGLIHDDKQEWGIVRIDENNILEIEEYPIKKFHTQLDKPSKKISQKQERKLIFYSFPKAHIFEQTQDIHQHTSLAKSPQPLQKIPTMNKRTAYQQLVAKRKRFKFQHGLINPSETPYDVDEIDPWAQWQNNLDAQILVVGQDYCDECTYIRTKAKVERFPHTYEYPSNANLKDLFALLGYDLGHPTNPNRHNPVFFTNAVMALKPGKMSSNFKDSWLKESRTEFLNPLIEIIQPKIIISLGRAAAKTLGAIFGFKIASLTTLANESPVKAGQTLIFPVFHPGGLGFATRPRDQQINDWLKIKEWLQE